MATWTKTLSKSTLISALRQFVVREYDGTRLYNNYPEFSNINSFHSLDLIIRKYGTKKEAQAFFDLFENESENWAFPIAGTIHNYLIKNDSDWYLKQEAFKK